MSGRRKFGLFPLGRAGDRGAIVRCAVTWGLAISCLFCWNLRAEGGAAKVRPIVSDRLVLQDVLAKAKGSSTINVELGARDVRLWGGDSVFTHVRFPTARPLAGNRERLEGQRTMVFSFGQAKFRAGSGDKDYLLEAKSSDIGSGMDTVVIVGSGEWLHIFAAASTPVKNHVLRQGPQTRAFARAFSAGDVKTVISSEPPGQSWGRLSDPQIAVTVNGEGFFIQGVNLSEGSVLRLGKEKDTAISFPNDVDVFPSGIHELHGSGKLFGCRFDSKSDAPLTFQLVPGRGYVCLSGSGTVTSSSGSVFQVQNGHLVRHR